MGRASDEMGGECNAIRCDAMQCNAMAGASDGWCIRWADSTIIEASEGEVLYMHAWYPMGRVITGEFWCLHACLVLCIMLAWYYIHAWYSVCMLAWYSTCMLGTLYAWVGHTWALTASK